MASSHPALPHEPLAPSGFLRGRVGSMKELTVLRVETIAEGYQIRGTSTRGVLKVLGHPSEALSSSGITVRFFHCSVLQLPKEEGSDPICYLWQTRIVD